MPLMSLCHCVTVSLCHCVIRSWGFMCPVHTPDGSPCGLLNHLSASCLVSTDLAAPSPSPLPLPPGAPLGHPSASASGSQKNADQILTAVTRVLCSCGMQPVYLGLPAGSSGQALVVLLDGRVIGHVSAELAEGAVWELRRRKVLGEPGVSH